MNRLALALLCGLALSLAPCNPPAAEGPESDPRVLALQEYVRLETTNPPGREAAGVAWLGDRLARAGLSFDRLVTPRGRESLVAVLPATEEPETAPSLVLLHHIDVVAAAGDWSHPPFGAEIVDGVLYGRGAVDAKSLGMAQLESFLAAARLERRERGLVLLAVADEEAGGLEGAGFVFEHYPEYFDRTDGVLNEGGINHFSGKKFDNWAIEVAQKVPLWLEVVAEGRGGHGSIYSPESPPHRLLRALTRILDIPPRWKLSPVVAQQMRAEAPFWGESFRRAFQNPSQILGPEGPVLPLPLPLRSLLIETIQINVLEGAQQINITPSRARAELDVRLMPETDPDEVLAIIREAAGSGVEVDVKLRGLPHEPSPTDSTVWKILTGELEKQAPVVPMFTAGFSDSRFFRAAGIPAYGFSPFLMELADYRGVHGPDEHIDIRVFLEGVERLQRLVGVYLQTPR